MSNSTTPTRQHLAAYEVLPAMKREAEYMANTLIGKYVLIFLVVSFFVAGNLQHSPANMDYFSLSMAMGGGPGWDAAFLWNIIPAGIGNILGGALLVALPFWYALVKSDDR